MFYHHPLNINVSKLSCRHIHIIHGHSNVLDKQIIIKYLTLMIARGSLKLAFSNCVKRQGFIQLYSCSKNTVFVLLFILSIRLFLWFEFMFFPPGLYGKHKVVQLCMHVFCYSNFVCSPTKKKCCPKFCLGETSELKTG